MASKEQIKACFDEYDVADKEVSATKAAYEATLVKRSECVRKILETTESKGPYNFKGSQVKIVVRGSTHFLRGRSVDGVIDVD